MQTRIIKGKLLLRVGEETDYPIDYWMSPTVFLSHYTSLISGMPTPSSKLFVYINKDIYSCYLVKKEKAFPFMPTVAIYDKPSKSSLLFICEDELSQIISCIQEWRNS